jgi:hypothetical protein
VFLFKVESVISVQTSQKFSEKGVYDVLEICRGNRRRSTVELGYNVMKGTEYLVSL